jgi:hypothetical protein
MLDKGDTEMVGGRTFDEATLAPFATVHLGFQL